MTGRNGDTRQRGPLDGIRVIDCATILAAPFAAAVLGDYGADVIKIEHPEGDGNRRNGPSVKGVSLKYAFLGRNKRHIVLNLSTSEGQEIFRELAAKSDVVIENFRPGIMERWGLGWEQLHALNRRLVMLRVTGFGQFGPYAKRRGFGTLAEAMSGFANLNGYPDGPPTLPPFGLADGVAALASAYAVMLALYDRDKRDGEGQMIDVALIEPLFHLLGEQAATYRLTGKIQYRKGNRSATGGPRNIYRTRDDRWVAIGAGSQSTAERCMQLVGRADMVEQPWFSSGPERFKHVDEIDASVSKWIGERDFADVTRTFEEAGAAVAPVYNIEQILADPQYQALESVVSVEDEDIGPIEMPNLLFRMSKTPGKVRYPGRRIGRDTDDVLRDELGLSEERLRTLREAGVTAPASREKAGGGT